MAKNKVHEIIITPQMFISPPFKKCPYCKEKEFGVVHIGDRTYTRRCRRCLQSSSYKLPPIKKRVLYLDQMAISEMMKLLNPKFNETRKSKVKSIWKDLFGKLDRLVKLQLIICPDSTSHYYESLIVPEYYQVLKRMYEQLSNGISFHDAEVIKSFQISLNFREWMGEKNLKDIDIYNVTSGHDIDSWQDRLRISVGVNDFDESIITNIKEEREIVGEKMKKVFERWQTEKSKNFTDWYEEERSAFGKMVFRSYLENIISDNPFSMMSQTNTLVVDLINRLSDKGLSNEEALQKIILYFGSNQIKEVPYIKISAGLFASIARKAANGQKKPLTIGDVNDIKAISSLAPYCEAMFIDNKMYYCQNTMDDFLDFLQKIEESASKSHLAKVKEVYGDTWGEPFVEMYEY